VQLNPARGEDGGRCQEFQGKASQPARDRRPARTPHRSYYDAMMAMWRFNVSSMFYGDI